MSAWKVYSKDGSVERCELKYLEYGGTAMGERAVTATFHHHSEVDFEVFDYIEYRGEKFELEAVPTVKKVSLFEYIYELRFVSLKYELERCEMRDLVPYDNEVVYPTPLTFSFTGNVRYLTERIQACLDALYGSGAWNIIIADGVESEEKNITIAQQNCWNALALVSSTYGLSFYIKGRTIAVGGEQPLVGHTFEYGRGNGLYEIERASDTNTGIVTKLRAYGSTRNLDYSYPKRPEWSDSALPVTFAFSPLRLMLPSFKTDGKTDYVLADSATIAKYGIREASMVYDDIYPSITGATYNGQAIDEIKNVEEVDDNSDSFVIYLHDLGFDLEEHLATSNPQISMKTGAMQGYTFTITKIEKQYENTATTDVTGEVNPDEDTPEGDTPEENLGEFVGYRITLNRISAEGGENYNIPNSDWSMKAGDKFVLLNILMPQKYIRDAENRLQARAEEYLEQYSKTNFSYNIGLHDKFLIENPSVYNSLIEGSKLRVRDTEIGIDEEVTIQSITITENTEDTILPQVKVTLNNEPSASTLERIQGRIDALANETAAGNFATQSEIMAQYRKKLDKPYFDKLFVAVDANGKEIPSNDMTTPVAYIKAKYNFAVVGGITSFVDDVDLDLPSIYDGLPIDGQTLRWKEVTDEDGSITRVLESVGGGTSEGNGTISSITTSGTGNAITSVTLSEDKTRLTFTKDKNFIDSEYLQEHYWNKTEITDKYYSKLDISNNYYNKVYIDENFITKDGASELFVTLDETSQTIKGVKNFVGELRVNDNPIVYNSEKGYWMFDGDLLVTGGVTAFANEDGYAPSSIMDALRVDEENLKVINGVLTFVGSTGGGTAEKVTWANIEGKPTWIGDSKPSYSWSEITGKPNFVTEEDLEEEGFLTAMDIQVLTFTSGTFKAVSYDPSMAPNTVNIPTKLSHLEDDSDFVTFGMMSIYATKTWVGQQGFLDSSDLNGYATKTWVGQQGFLDSSDLNGYATEDWVDENYFSINGGQLHGNLWLRSGTEKYGRRIIFGDVRTSNEEPYVYIGEDTEDDLTIASWGDFRIKVGDGAYLTYIKDDGYWEITGDVLVTGGITSYE